jgi:hypothetical protein
MNYCNRGGHIVGADEWLPADPHDYFCAAYAITDIGCNNLVCSRCGQSVRHALGYLRVPLLDPAILHAAPQWRDLEGAQPQDERMNGRLYVCACEACVEHSGHALDPGWESDPDQLPLWKCAGHPSFVPPGRFAEVHVDTSAGWSPIVAAHIVERTKLHPYIDRIPGFTLTRIYQALERSDDQRALGNAVGGRGDDPSLAVRQAVVLFFLQNSHAPGFEQVLDAWRAAPSLYDAHRSAWGRDPWLEEQVLEAIWDRIANKASCAEAALATWRWAALRGAGLGNLYLAVRFDGAWVGEHVEAMFDATPSDWHSIICAVDVDPMRLVAGCRRAIAEGDTNRERVIAALTEKYRARAGAAIDAL